MSIVFLLLQIFCGLLFVLFFISILPWKISLDGNLVLKETIISTKGVVKFGTNQFGLSVLPSKIISLGPYQNPWFQFSIKKSRRTQTKLDDTTKRKKFLSIKYMKPAIKSLQWNQFDLTGKLGFKNSAHTGIVFGGLQALNGSIVSSRFTFNIRPLFTHQLDTALTGSICFKLIPVLLVWNLTKTYFNFSFQKG